MDNVFKELLRELKIKTRPEPYLVVRLEVEETD